ncbi:GNAT family N-acetyltransferase [Gymnodinialimonas hymeniacidonis]|uniref:GNAT family N-acetyltransferase n=1 Tax=Gymnodinialimonas hymeniacidonis TaxID=3126508 RepID=UPI0034C60333
MLTAWQALPHVAEWWDDEPVFDADDLDDPRLSLNVVSCDGTPFAFQQTYSVKGWEFEHHFGHFPEGARGIDQFIGPTDWLGKGHGSGFIMSSVARMFSDGVPVVATDPHPGNTRAIRAYEKAGFQAHGPVMDTQWGLILPMSVWVAPPRDTKRPPAWGGPVS